MIAFTVFWWPIYRYGIAYAVTFLTGYFWLQWIARSSYLDSYPQVKLYLQNSLDEFVMAMILAIFVWWRLWHVFLYEWNYYSTHLSEIVMVNQWGMSFLWGVIAVVLMLLWIQYKHRFSRVSLKVLGDLILCVVPLGIFLGRIANFLNQEMVGKAITSFPFWFQKLSYSLWLIHVYDQVDTLERFNINITQSVFEWLLLLCIGQILFSLIYSKFNINLLLSKLQDTNQEQWFQNKLILMFKRNLLYVQKKFTKPWLIVSVFFMCYGFVRFLEEFTKDVGTYELWWWLTVSQRLSIALFLIGVGMIWKNLSAKRIMSVSIVLLFSFLSSSTRAKETWTVDELIGNVAPTQSNGFTRLAQYYSTDGSALYLRNEVAEAFQLMDHAFFQRFGYHLQLNSAFRSYAQQKTLRDAYPDLQLRITALPGTSQHHCCAIDINKDELTREKTVSPWLQNNAWKFGFIMPYLLESEYGFEQEDRHYVYAPMLEDYKKNYFELLNNALLDILNKNTLATKYNILKSYVLGNDFITSLEKYKLQQKRSLQKRKLQYLSFLHEKKSLISGYVLLGSGDNGVLYYKVALKTSNILDYSIKELLWTNDRYQYIYYARMRNGTLIKLSHERKVNKKMMVYVILDPTFQ